MPKPWYHDTTAVSPSTTSQQPSNDPPGLRPNPSIAGTSRYSHSELWLYSEMEILTWWETVREELLIPVALVGDESPLLQYEKEVLEWWHNVRGEYGYV